MDPPSPPAVPGGGAWLWSVDQHKGGSQEPPKVVRRRDDTATFKSLLIALPLINQLVHRLGYFVSQPIAKPVSNAINNAKQELERRLKSCLKSLGRPPPPLDVTNVQPGKKRKTGPKIGREKKDQQKILEIVAVNLV